MWQKRSIGVAGKYPCFGKRLDRFGVRTSFGNVAKGNCCGNGRNRKEQSRILNFSTDVENPVQVVYNDRWLSPLTFANVVELASNFTVNQLLGRESYAKRIEDGTPLYLHELLYPLMQGYDSVALNVDLEVGGSDQIPNMLAGRTLMERMLQREKWVLAMRLIEDPSGAKMGKTTGNFFDS
jgi:tyrosyl-tRNA synthetase